VGLVSRRGRALVFALTGGREAAGGWLTTIEKLLRIAGMAISLLHAANSAHTHEPAAVQHEARTDAVRASCCSSEQRGNGGFIYDNVLYQTYGGRCERD
jgi:hypothetical protein